ncbi:Potassium voltage-gated channel subfamily H member 6 [Orchesella cincta]|uniref:Potassium voltage-gated channel subfamily H member 6 n=1 Tax=Orchesella cincta TaxID=48709 RepID=A0A1D2MI65_ORCCI|nr:Potassium voltage-gated channel subfamily H member 6 [Orchesella cincta]
MPIKKNKLYEKKQVVGLRRTKDRLAEKFLRGKVNSEDSTEYYGSDDEEEAWENVDEKNKGNSKDKDPAKGGLRKHPYHKESWGPYPNVNITQDAHPKKPKEARIIPKKQLRSIQARLNEVRAEKKNEAVTDDAEPKALETGRSAGNVSIRNVLATLRLKNKPSLSLYYRIKKIKLPRAIKFIARFGLIWELVMYVMIVTTFSAISFSAFFAFFEEELWQMIELTDYIFAFDTILRLTVEIWRYRTRATVVVYTAPYTFEPIDYLLYNRVNNLEGSYLRNYQQKKPGYGSSPWDIFVITTNFATAVVTTVGYGDVTPTNELEMSICIICMLVGAIFLNGYFTSQLTNFVVELDGARFDLFYRLREIRRYLASLKTLPFFNAKVEEYYKYLWTYREGVFDVRFMQQFTQTFHEELLFNTCKEMFDKSQLFIAWMQHFSVRSQSCGGRAV